MKPFNLGSAAADDVSPAYRTYVLVALAVVAFMCSVDKVVISMFMEPIKKEFLLSDTQLGLMTGLAFALLGGVVAVPLARLADRGNRKWIIGASFAVWTVMTAASGMAGSFLFLLGSRIGVGVGEAGCVPATHSMLGDYYPRALRARALAAHGAGTYLGILGGMVGGGILVQTVGWRAGFISLGAVGLVLAIIFHLTVREPKRIDALALGAAPGKGMLAQLGDLHAFGLLVIAFATVTLAGAAATWLPSYFERAFALTPIQIGLGLGVGMGLASAIGAIVGGQMSVRHMRHSRSWGARYAALVSWILLPFFIGSFFVPNALLAFFLLFMALLIAGTLTGPVFATLQELVSPHARATAVAVVSIAAVVIGQGMGPMLVGMVSDMLNTKNGSVGGLRIAMSSIALVNVVTGLLFWLLARRIDALALRSEDGVLVLA